MVRFTRGGVAYTVLGSVTPYAADAGRAHWPGELGPRPSADELGAGFGRRRAAADRGARIWVKRYGELTAVAGVDLTVRTGDVYGYLGPNGAGKTTSLRMMLGLIRPTEGSVRLFGRDPMESVARWRAWRGSSRRPPSIRT